MSIFTGARRTWKPFGGGGLTTTSLGGGSFGSTLGGGLFALRFRDRLHYLLSFTAGVLLGVVSFEVLPEIFELAPDRISGDLVASRAINWGNDRFARGAYSYATPQTRAAQSTLSKPQGGAIFFAGEALYAGPDMGTVEAALASGLETAQTILAAGR